MITLTSLAAIAAAPPVTSPAPAQCPSQCPEAANGNNANNAQGEAAAPQTPFAFLLAQRSVAGAPRAAHVAVAMADKETDAKLDKTDGAVGADQASAQPLFWLNLPVSQDAPRTLATLAPAATGSAGEKALGSTGAAATDAKPGASAGPKAAPIHVLPAAEPELHTQVQAFVLPASNQAHHESANNSATAATAALAAAANQTPPAPAMPATVATIESKVGTPRWTRDIQENISLLVQSNTSVASLKLTPADMGPIEIRIDFSEKQPSVSISVQQADTRNALDAALPRLREMLAESGVNLGDTSVSQQHPQGGDASGHERAPADLRVQRPEPAAVPAAPAARLLALDQIVDTYA